MKNHVLLLIVLLIASSCKSSEQKTMAAARHLVDTIIYESLMGVATSWDKCPNVKLHDFDTLLHMCDFQGFSSTDSIFVGSYNKKLSDVTQGHETNSKQRGHDIIDIPFYFKFKYDKVISSKNAVVDFSKFMDGGKDDSLETRIQFSNVFVQDSGYLVVIQNSSTAHYPENMIFVSLSKTFKVVAVRSAIDWCE